MRVGLAPAEMFERARDDQRAVGSTAMTARSSATASGTRSASSNASPSTSRVRGSLGSKAADARHLLHRDFALAGLMGFSAYYARAYGQTAARRDKNYVSRRLPNSTFECRWR